MEFHDAVRSLHLDTDASRISIGARLQIRDSMKTGMTKYQKVQYCDLLHLQARAQKVQNGTTAIQDMKHEEFYMGYINSATTAFQEKYASSLITSHWWLHWAKMWQCYHNGYNASYHKYTNTESKSYISLAQTDTFWTGYPATTIMKTKTRKLKE